MTDSKFLKIMVNLALIEDAEDLHALSRMAMMKKEARKALAGTGTTVYEIPLEEAMLIGLRMSEFYDELLNRDVLFRNAGKNEEIHVNLGSRPQSRAPADDSGSGPDSAGDDQTTDLFDVESKSAKPPATALPPKRLRDQLYRTMSGPDSVPVHGAAAPPAAAAAAPVAVLEHSTSMPPDVHAAALAAETISKQPSRAVAKSEMRQLM